MALKSIPKPTALSEKAYESIKNAIVSNEIHPGEVLAEEALAAQLGISRTPIRTALHRLVFEEIAVVRSKNIVVADVTEADVRQVSVVRIRLEPLAVQLIGENGGLTAAQLNGLRQCAARQHAAAEERDGMRFLDQDYCFHTQLAALSGNSFLSDMVEKSNLIIRRFHLLSSSLLKHSIPAADEHATIIDALAQHDFPAAATLLRQHLERVDARFFT